MSKSKEPAALRRVSTVQLPGRTEAFDPGQFFQTRDGLYVQDGFRRWIVTVAKPVASVPATEVAPFDLVNSVNYSDLRSELPEGHLFEDPSVFCAYLAGMLERQADGRDGDLITTGSANIFYVRGVAGWVFAVYVDWYRRGQRWDVDAHIMKDDRWRAGNRAFSRSG